MATLIDRTASEYAEKGESTIAEYISEGGTIDWCPPFGNRALPAIFTSRFCLEV